MEEISSSDKWGSGFKTRRRRQDIDEGWEYSDDSYEFERKVPVEAHTHNADKSGGPNSVAESSRRYLSSLSTALEYRDEMTLVKSLLKERLQVVEEKIYDLETVYLSNSSSFGNMLRGWSLVGQGGLGQGGSGRGPTGRSTSSQHSGTGSGAGSGTGTGSNSGGGSAVGGGGGSRSSSSSGNSLSSSTLTSQSVNVAPGPGPPPTSSAQLPCPQAAGAAGPPLVAGDTPRVVPCHTPASERRFSLTSSTSRASTEVHDVKEQTTIA